MKDCSTDVVVVGGGAAGLMCARVAGRRGRRVVVVDRASQVGVKVLLSGGGKCNFGNRQCGAENYISENVHFCKSALSRFCANDFLSLLEEYGIAYEQREYGRLFCLGSAGELVRMLEKECAGYGVVFQLGCAVGSIRKEGRFVVGTQLGDITAEAVVVATGGLSYRQAGASGLGYEIAEQFGLAVTGRRPGLVPLLYDKAELAMLGELTGISVEAAVSCKGKRFLESVLFTQQGLSGPGILQVSNYWQGQEVITIDWLPGVDVYEVLVDQKRRKGAWTIQQMMASYLPKRMAQLWGQRYFPEKPLAECSAEQIRGAAKNVNGWLFRPRASQGYNKAEVTLGGVSTDGLSSRTMESHQAAGLYFVGEVVDVTGQLGGYNLQWAWSSGFAAGCAV